MNKTEIAFWSVLLIIVICLMGGVSPTFNL
jgi:hypothetical protein